MNSSLPLPAVISNTPIARKHPSFELESSVPLQRPSNQNASRIACLHLPDLAMQLLLRDNPRFAGKPAVIVDRVSPQATIRAMNHAAKQRGLSLGMRYGTARGLVPELRGATVSDERIEAALTELTTALQVFTPAVEKSERLHGVFWLDPMGLRHIYGDERTWAQSIYKYLSGRGYHASIIVGFGRMRTQAIARVSKGAHVITHLPRERELAAQVALCKLDISARLLEGLTQLGIETLGDVVRIPKDELRNRFGDEAKTLHEEAVDDSHLPVQRELFEEALCVRIEVDPPDNDQARLLFGIKRDLPMLMHALQERAEALTALSLQIIWDGKGGQNDHIERIEPAEPTRDVALLTDLIRLRLARMFDARTRGVVQEDVRGQRRIETIIMTAESVSLRREQLALFATTPKRDPKAAHRAIARLRAAFGETSTTVAKLQPAHLPEARFQLVPVKDLPTRSPPPVEKRGPKKVVAVAESVPSKEARPEAPQRARRVLRHPETLKSAADNTPILPKRFGELQSLQGPYRISGGWWNRLVERDYHDAFTSTGDIVWVYYDKRRQHWFLHGWVE